MAEREEFSFTQGDLGILSTEEFDPISMGESFLGSNPDDLKFVGRDIEEKKEKERKEKEDKGKLEKEKKEEKKEVKEVVVPKKEVEPDTLFNKMEGKDNEEEEEEEEDETNTDVTKKTGGQQNEGGEGDDEVNPYLAITKEMITQGIFEPDVDGEGNEVEPSVKTPEQLLERFRVESRREAAEVVDKFLERFGPEYKDMFENVFVKGVSPADYLNRYTKIESLKGLDLTDEGNQERVVRELYRQDGRSAEYIDKQITKHKNYNDLADEATEAQRILTEREEKAIQDSVQRKQDDLTRRQQIRNDYMNSVNKIITEKMNAKEFDGIPVDRKFAQETYNYITQERYQTKDSQLLTEFDKDVLDLARPENHELKVKIAMLLQMAKVDPKLTKIAKKAVSKENGELFRGLTKKALREKGTTTNTKEKEEGQPESWFK